MSTTTPAVPSASVPTHTPDPPQYGWGMTLAVWTAATLPMGLAA